MPSQVMAPLEQIPDTAFQDEMKVLRAHQPFLNHLFAAGEYLDCVSRMRAHAAHLIGYLYLRTVGREERVDVILSDISFWDIIGDDEFRDTAGMLVFACQSLLDDTSSCHDMRKAVELIKTGCDALAEFACAFMASRGHAECIAPDILERREQNAEVQRIVDSLQEKLLCTSDDFGCLAPPFIDFCLSGFSREEARLWSGYISLLLSRAGLLPRRDLVVLDAAEVVRDHVGMSSELIRRLAIQANGSTLLVNGIEEFDIPCLGGTVLDRVMRTLITTADRYQGSQAIILSGTEETIERALHYSGSVRKRFPYIINI